MPVELTFQVIIIIIIVGAWTVGSILFHLGKILWTGRLPNTRSDAGNGGADGPHDSDGSDGDGGGGD